MGRPPSNGGPAFRFTAAEVSEMEAILQQNNNAVPAKEVLTALAEKFSESEGRKGKIIVQMKQVWNWFQNKRYAIRARSVRTPGKLNITPMTREEPGPVKSIPPPMAAPASAVSGRFGLENSLLEFEANSGRDGAWYDVASFISHRHLETGDPEVLVRFAGFTPEEDEWVNVRRHVRPRSLPCESSECVAVIPGDLILCFQEGKEQALYFDAHVLDAQRRRHDVRGCRCRFLVRYDHDQSEEIVPLRKVCRRPETDHRLQQLHGVHETTPLDQQKIGFDPAAAPAVQVSNSAETVQKQMNTGVAMVPQASSVNVPVASQAASLEQKNTEAATDTSAESFNISHGGAASVSNMVTSSGTSATNQNIPEGK